MGLKMLKGSLILLLIVATMFLVSPTSAHEQMGGKGLKDDKHLLFFKPFLKPGLLGKRLGFKYGPLGKRLGFKYGPFGKRAYGLGKGFGPFGGAGPFGAASGGAASGGAAAGGAAFFPSSINNGGFGRKFGKLGDGGGL